MQQRRPLYQFNPDIASISTTASRGRSNYNGLQSTFKQRLWKGLDFVANYTWSKAMANNSGYFGNAGVAGEGAYPMNSYDIEANYGPAAYDARHIVSLAGSYELPFGTRAAVRRGLEPRARRDRGRLVDELRRHRAHRLPDHRHRRRQPVAAGLALAGTARTGSADGAVDDPTLERWIDRAAFVSAPRGQFGDAGVGILRAPGYWNIDMSVSKRFTTFGRQYLMVRGEMFNALNHPNFGAPNANIQSTAFGTITSTVGDARVVQLVAKSFLS